MKILNPPQANTLLQNNPKAVLIDVRSTMEYEYIGHPLGAVHIPIKEPPTWDTDIAFVDNTRKMLKQRYPEERLVEDLPLLLLCRSGKRSELSATLLINAGFKDVSNVVEGFEGDKDKNGHRSTINGWRSHNLPWEQS